MGKNIILCSDGTGNKGGYGADTNVFKLYNAVDIHNAKTQITFYDDGVGTHKNKYIRGFTGAFGWGFQNNVLELYKFLARNYETGDDIFLFGFSRGAATVRALAGMLQECGLVHAIPEARRYGDFDEQELEKLTKEAMKLYEKRFDSGVLEKIVDGLRSLFKLDDKRRKDPTGHKKRVEKFGNKVRKTENFTHIEDPPIKFIGVWDTVSALGFPQDWTSLFNVVFGALQSLSDVLFPHSFYNYQLGQSVESVYHAIAIDDERKTFHPKIWREKCAHCGKSDPHDGLGNPEQSECDAFFDRPRNIEQVWFAGVHSNVGGGYERPGMSLVALQWMMERARDHGLEFKSDIYERIAAAANVHEKLYDSRDAAALYYRYAPRRIDQLCHDYVVGPVKIHRSVIDRIRQGTARYAPSYLPYEFEIVDTPLGASAQIVHAAVTNEEWNINRKEIDRYVKKRENLYRIFAELSAVLVGASIWFFFNPPKTSLEGATSSAIKEGLTFIVDLFPYDLSRFLDGMITYLTEIEPFYVWILVVVGIGLFIRRQRLLSKTRAACERARAYLLHSLSPSGSTSADIDPSS